MASTRDAASDTVPEANPEIGHWIRTGTARTNYHDVGDGQPVVLLHGSGPGVSAWANWRLTLGPLSNDFRVIAPDLAGFGFTEYPAGDTLDKGRWVGHVLDLLDALELEWVDLVGNSFGGAIALAVAIAHPERVRRLVLMGSVGVAFPITPWLEAVWGYEPSVAAMRGLLDIFAHDRSRVTDELAELRYRASIRPGVHEAFARMFPPPRQAALEALASDERAIATLSQPTLIVHGREDRVIPAEVSRRLFDLIPNAELHMFGNCGHWTQIEHADRFNRVVRNFLVT